MMNKFIDFWFTVPVPVIALIIVIIITIIYTALVLLVNVPDKENNAPKIKKSKFNERKR